MDDKIMKGCGPGAVYGVTKKGQCGHNYPLGKCPMCNPEAPTTEPGTPPFNGTIERHPAYAMIGAHRWTGTADLYGSEFLHPGGISVTIKRSAMNHSLSRDWPSASGRQDLISVNMSEAQWATMISSLNQGDGVPCTLDYFDGRKIVGIKKVAAPKTEIFKSEVRETLKDGLDKLAELRARLVSGKSGKEALSLLDGATQEITSNIEYVAKTFGEHVEETVEKAKVEINAYLTGGVHRLGLEASAAAHPLLQVESWKPGRTQPDDFCAICKSTTPTICGECRVCSICHQHREECSRWEKK